MTKVLEFSVLGFPPVPWSVPNFGSGTSKTGKRFTFSTRGKKTKLDEFRLSLEDWQKQVGNEARIAMSKASFASLFCGPVLLQVEFIAQTPPGRKHGEIWFGGVMFNSDSGKYVKGDSHEPDLTNLTKAVEDALEGNCICDDVQIAFHTTFKRYGPTPGIRVSLWIGLDSHYPGTGDPVPMPDPSPTKSSHAKRQRTKKCKETKGLRMGAAMARKSMEKTSLSSSHSDDSIVS